MATGGFNYLPEVGLALAREASRILRTGAFNIERRAKQNVQSMHAIDTGALLNATYTITDRGSGYAQAAAQGEAKGRKVLSDEPTLPMFEARVVNAMEYAFFVDQGTRHMPARPFMTMAAESEREPFFAAWGRMHLVPGMGGGEY